MNRPKFEVTPLDNDEYQIEPKQKVIVKGVNAVGVFIESYTGAWELVAKDEQNQQDTQP